MPVPSTGLPIASSTSAGTTIHWQEANAEGLPFPDATFDVAVCSLGLQFFARAPPAGFFWQYMLGTPLPTSVAGLDAGERAALESDMVGRWQSFADDTGMDCRTGLTLATAARGAS